MLQPDIMELLEAAGAHPRGNRHDCPQCGGLRTVTHSDECFYCHKCQWSGNTVILAKRLGIYRRLPQAEYLRLRREREQVREAAARLYAAAKAQWGELMERLHGLNRIEAAAHAAGPEHPATWGALAYAYAQRPGILAELTLLENCGAAHLTRFLLADRETRSAAADLSFPLYWKGESP